MYDLLIEYALLGEDYDSVTTHYKDIVDNLGTQLDECDLQQEALEGIINELKEYIAKLEEEVAANRRKMRFLKTFSYISAGANALLTIFLIVK